MLLINAKNELEQAIYAAKDALRSSGIDDMETHAKVAEIENWCDESGPGTPLSHLKAKYSELQSVLALAAVRM